MIAIAVATLAVILASWFLFFSNRRRRRLSDPKPPPCVPGLPLLGNALPLGKHGADYLYQCWKHYGDAFTLHAAGQKMTFLFEPTSLVYYFRAPESELSFLPAVEQWTKRVFGLLPADFIPRHHLILNTTRNLVGRNGAENIHQHAKTLIPLLRQGIAQWITHTTTNDTSSYDGYNRWVRLELSQAISKLVFSASVEALFGRKFLQRHGKDYLYQSFFDFEQCFELAASPISHVFQPKFKNSRRKLLEALTTSFFQKDFIGSTIGDLIQESGMPPHAVPNMLLAILWASQANTVPTAFWTLGFLLLPENKKSYLNEITALLDQQDLSQLACDTNSLLIKCCMESLRLRSSSTDVRIAAKSFILNMHKAEGKNHQEKFLIEKGTMVMICPWISHLDPRLYEDQPEVFNPHRQGAALSASGSDDGNSHEKIKKNKSKSKSSRELHSAAAGVGGLAGLAFGGGKFRCPGRGFAEMELGLVVGMIVDELELELLLPIETTEKAIESGLRFPGDPHGLLPKPDVRRLVGIKVPDGPCWVRVRQRKR
jgi:cytochrome P450